MKAVHNMVAARREKIFDEEIVLREDPDRVWVIVVCMLIENPSSMSYK
jgi:hypothetical protein